MKRKHVVTVLFCIVLIALSGCDKAVLPSPVFETMPILTPSATVLQTQDILSASPSATPSPSPSETIGIATRQTTETPAVTLSPTPSMTHTITPTTKSTPKPTAKLTAKPTKKPVRTASPKPSASIKPSASPGSSDITSMSSSYKKAVLSGINYVRTHNGDYAADPIDHLDSTLSAKAQAHAEEMARKGDIFHSGWGPESVAYGDLTNGESAGVKSAVHAAGLLDPEITRIGVGAVKTADGTIYLCVDGGK